MATLVSLQITSLDALCEQLQNESNTLRQLSEYLESFLAAGAGRRADTPYDMERRKKVGKRPAPGLSLR